MLTDEEYSKLKNECPNIIDDAIQNLSEYIEMKGYKCKSHYLALRRWGIDAVKERQGKKGFENASFNVDEFESMGLYDIPEVKNE